MEEDSMEESEESELWEPPVLPMLTWPVLPARTGLIYDQRMMSHCNLWDKYAVRGLGYGLCGCPPPQALSPYLCFSHPTSHHPETPQRILRIMCHLEELGLAGRCLILPARPATDVELLTCHRSHIWTQGRNCDHDHEWDLGVGTWSYPPLCGGCCKTEESLSSYLRVAPMKGTELPHFH